MAVQKPPDRALISTSLLGDLDLVQDPGDGDDTRILLRHLLERVSVMHCGAGGHHVPLSAGLGLLPSARGTADHRRSAPAGMAA